jgi:hypothetical protein
MAFAVTAQQAKPKADTVKRDTVKNRYLPTGLRIGTDVLALVKSNVQDNFSGWEVNADVDFHRYFLAFDYGSWARTYPGDSASYSNDGRYWRIGADVNFLTKDVDRNMFFLGLRYGHSTFSENMTITAEDPVWGVVTGKNYINTDVTSRWYELTTGIRVKIWKAIWMGYTARFKFGLKNNGAQDMLPHDVPGYGRTDRETDWGFNYHVFIRLPFRKMPPLPPAKKKK